MGCLEVWSWKVHPSITEKWSRTILCTSLIEYPPFCGFTNSNCFLVNWILAFLSCNCTQCFIFVSWLILRACCPEDCGEVLALIVCQERRMRRAVCMNDWKLFWCCQVRYTQWTWPQRRWNSKSARFFWSLAQIVKLFGDFDRGLKCRVARRLEWLCDAPEFGHHSFVSKRFHTLIDWSFGQPNRNFAVNGVTVIVSILSHEHGSFHCCNNKHSPNQGMFSSISSNIGHAFLSLLHLSIHPIHEWIDRVPS